VTLQLHHSGGMEVYWLEQSEADVPESNEWLGPSELRDLQTLRFPKRLMEWRLGRWTAKCAFAIFQGVPVQANALADIEIRAAPSGSPQVFVSDQPADATISISHRSGRAICAIAGAGIKLGCDLELIEPHSQAFIEDYLTHEEQILVAQTSAEDHDRLVALLWSGKESALKAMRVGLRVDTRCITVQPGEAHLVGRWTPLITISTAAERFHGWWRQAQSWVQTVVANPAPKPPIQMRILSPNQQIRPNSQKRAG